MFAETTCFTRMSIHFITCKRKSSNYLTESGGARMAEARVPEVDTGGEGEATGGGGAGGGGSHRVQIARTVTAVE
jgi:hypothetical protein